MAKNDKKIANIVARIKQLEADMQIALKQKTSNKAAFDVPGCMKKIADLRKDLQLLK